MVAQSVCYLTLRENVLLQSYAENNFYVYLKKKKFNFFLIRRSSIFFSITDTNRGILDLEKKIQDIFVCFRIMNFPCFLCALCIECMARCKNFDNLLLDNI